VVLTCGVLPAGWTSACPNERFPVRLGRDSGRCSPADYESGSLVYSTQRAERRNVRLIGSRADIIQAYQGIADNQKESPRRGVPLLLAEPDVRRSLWSRENFIFESSACASVRSLL